MGKTLDVRWAFVIKLEYNAETIILSSERDSILKLGGDGRRELWWNTWSGSVPGSPFRTFTRPNAGFQKKIGFLRWRNIKHFQASSHHPPSFPSHIPLTLSYPS